MKEKPLNNIEKKRISDIIQKIKIKNDYSNIYTTSSTYKEFDIWMYRIKINKLSDKQLSDLIQSIINN